MTPYFSTPQRIQALQAAAAAWLGTPYAASGAVLGHGASCHRLAPAVLSAAGFPFPPVPERGATLKRAWEGAMLDWLSARRAEFARVPGYPAELPAVLQPGDVLVCRIGIGHIALFLGGPGMEALQVLRGRPAHLVPLRDPNVARLLVAAYRPLDSAMEEPRHG